MINKRFLDSIKIKKTRGKNSYSYANCICTFDTETSKICKNPVVYDKKKKEEVIKPVVNYVVFWSVSILNVDTEEIQTEWGRRPDELVDFIENIKSYFDCDKMYFYAHNLQYDWEFLRKFFYLKDAVKSQLNTKPHFPIMVTFRSGIVLKDSLIIAQRKLEKWAEDLDTPHKKAVGYWDYNKIRTQSEEYTKEEIIYGTFDTIALAECLYKTMKLHGKSVYTIPVTATAIPRQESYKIGRKHAARNTFLKCYLTYEQQEIAEKVYHGGYTHANRYIIGQHIKGEITCYDFASSYPFCMVAYKYPMEKFTPCEDMKVEDVIRESDETAYMFKLIATNIEIKKECLMPSLSFSKAEAVAGYTLDNGRILKCEYLEMYMTEVDLEIFYNTYDYDAALCTDMIYAYKDYLPRWFTDYVYKCFCEKTQYKGGDAVIYTLKKYTVNSLYGMMVQHPVQDDWIEDIDGNFSKREKDKKEAYEKYINKEKTILCYQWGIWVTAYAMRNLYKLCSFASKWYYSDTDSGYGSNWDETKINDYNNEVKQLLKERGYPSVLCENNGKYYTLGVAEVDGIYSEFKTVGSKRYCVRDKKKNELKITIAGVPKKEGAKKLDNNIDNFRVGFKFVNTGKLAHSYITNDITEKDGIIYADSIDLNSVEYELGKTDVDETLLSEDIEIIYIEESEL